MRMYLKWQENYESLKYRRNASVGMGAFRTPTDRRHLILLGKIILVRWKQAFVPLNQKVFGCV